MSERPSELEEAVARSIPAGGQDMKLTEAQRREWEQLIAGSDADLDTLERAGLVESRVEIRLSGPKLTRTDVVWLTDEGRALLRTDPTP